jgi:integrase
MDNSKGVSVYARSGRPHYYVSFVPPHSYDRVHRATHFRVNDPAGKSRAYEWACEQAKLSRVYDAKDEERWFVWVVPFLEQQYRKRPLTLQRYMTSWKYLDIFLGKEAIKGPRAVTFQNIRDYIDWRTGPEQKKRSGKLVSHNTAMTDVEAFRLIMGEAVRRGWRPDNPCRELGIARDDPKEKREITDDEMARIITALDDFVAKRPHKDWMRISWEIARWQGCRLSETQFDIRRHVNLKDGTIWFRGKGGKIIHTTLHPQLKPYLENMLKQGRTFTCRFPKMGVGAAGAASKFFRQFFDTLGLPDVSFHCTRVTVITKLIRAGAPLAQVMAFIGHADEEVNRIYRKLKPRDLVGVTAALSYSSGSAQNLRSTGGGGIP